MIDSLPDDLRELQQKCDATHGEPPTLQRTNYFDSLRKCHIRHCTSQEPEIQESLLACWFPHVKHIVKDSMLPSIHIDEIGLLISALCKNNTLLERCVDNTERAELLACLCMTRAQMTEHGYVHPPMNNIGTLLALWSGNPSHREAYKSLEHTVNILYGPVCWSLYRDEVTSSSAFPGYLYDLHLPLAGIEKSAAKHSRDVELPLDIS